MFLSSCVVTDYYQVFKTNTENGIVNKKEIVFEDNNCKVFYNLWKLGGDVGFNIYNKTDSDLILQLNKTFFVLNGVAYEYFQNRTFIKSESNGTTLMYYNKYPSYWNNNLTNVTGTSSTSYSTQFNEKSELTIPPKTMIDVSEFKVTNMRYVSCELAKYPSANKIRTVKYNKDNSPFVFYNLITYTIKKESYRLENRFNVSEITNYPSSEMFTFIDTTFCGRKLDFPTRVFKNETPDKFYIEYHLDK